MEPGCLSTAGDISKRTWAIPLPASTQWDIVEAQAERAEPVFGELVRQAAQGDVVYNDDTGGQDPGDDGRASAASGLGRETAADRGGFGEEAWAGAHGHVHLGDRGHGGGHKIALFLSGRQHAGENLKDVLVRRAAELPPPIQMCDALSRNVPEELKTILANCLAHGRRQFVDVADRFPEECRHVLEAFSVVYRNDAIARSGSCRPRSGCSFIRPKAARPWRNSTSGLAGSSTSGGWSPTRRWAGRFRTCCGIGRN